jgi:hypothetical protein
LIFKWTLLVNDRYHPSSTNKKFPSRKTPDLPLKLAITCRLEREISFLELEAANNGQTSAFFLEISLSQLAFMLTLTKEIELGIKRKTRPSGYVNHDKGS